MLLYYGFSSSQLTKATACHHDTIPRALPPPNIEDLQPIKSYIRYEKTINLVVGLDGLRKELHSPGIFVCANNGVDDFWFQCRSSEAAAEVLKSYCAGNYLTLKWFTKKT